MPLDVGQRELDQAHAGKRLGLVLGLNQFEDEGWRSLRYAEHDADDMAATLSAPDRGGFRVTRLGAGTTRAGFYKALAQLKTENTSPQDIVVIYVSTHGSLARDEAGKLQRYLVVKDTHLDRIKQTGVSLEDVEAQLAALPSRRKVLILATCHSGTGKSLLPPDVLAELEGTKAPFFTPPLEETSRASIVLAACDWGETAREDEGLGHDIYTHFLLEALNKPADRNGDGAVEATEAHDYARRKTYEFTHGQQHPSARVEESGADPIVLSGKIDREGSPELYGYASDFDGLRLRVDGQDVATFPGGATVSAGTHQVQLLKGSGLGIYDAEVKLTPGERLDVSDLVATPESKLTVGLGLGYQGFLDQAAAATVAGPTPALQLSLGRADLLARHLGLQADLSFTTGERTVSPTAGEAAVPFRYLGGQLGLSVLYERQWGPVGMGVGPRLGMVYLERRFDLDAIQTAQRYVVVSPGLSANVSLRLDARWFVFIRGDAAAEVISVDGESQVHGYGCLWAGVGFRP